MTPWDDFPLASCFVKLYLGSEWPPATTAAATAAAALDGAATGADKFVGADIG